MSEDPGIWQCTINNCGYQYDPARGDRKGGIPPGVKFEELPDDWKCPSCGVGKEFFVKVA